MAPERKLADAASIVIVTPTPAIFVDKDGTVLVDEPYNVDPSLMRLAPGADTGLRRLGRLNLPLFVVTNQAGVALGRFSEAALGPMRRHLASMFEANGARLQDCYYCPHLPADGCSCRKPLPGMLHRAAREHGLDLSRSWLVGDILNDIEAGRRAGCMTILLDNGNETEWLDGPLRRPHYVVADLDEAARLIASPAQRVPRRRAAAEIA